MAANLQFVVSAIDQFSQTFNDLDRNVSRSIKIAGTMGKAMMVGGAAVGAGLGMAVKKAADFEAQMDKVGALSGATGDQFDQLRNKALELGANTSKSASEVAIAMQDLAAKGFDVNGVMGAMPGIIAAAEASGEDLAATSDVVSSALNAWHMKAADASKVADVLAMAANKSAAGVEDMGFAFKYAAPVANSLGIGMNELAAATGIMTNAGLKGEQAGTTLRMAMLRLIDPPKEAAKMMDKLGFSATDSQGNFKSMSQIIGDLSGSLKGMTQTQKAAALSTLFGAESVTGMLAVLDGGKKQFDDFVAALDKSGGSAKATAAIMRDNLAGAWDEMTGALETASISIGSSLLPAMKSITSAVTTAINAFNGLPQGVQSAIAIGAVATAAFSLLAGGILFVVSLIPGFIGGFSAIAAALGTTAGAMAVTIGWVALIAAAIVGIGIALVVAYKKVDWFRNGVNKAWSVIKTAALAAWTQIKSSVMTAIDAVKGAITAAMPAIQAIWTVAWFIIKSLIISTWEAIKNVVQGALKVISGIFNFFSALFQGDLGGMWDAIKQIFLGAIQLIWGWVNLMFVGKVLKAGKLLFSGLKGVVASGWSAIKTLFSTATASIKSTALRVFTAIKSTITGVLTKVKSAFMAAWNYMSRLTSSTLRTIWNTVKAIFNGIRSTITSVINGVKSFFGGAWRTMASAARSAASSIWSAVKSKFNSMISTIRSTMSSVKSKVRSGFNSALAYLRGINLVSVGKHIIQGLINGIGSMAGALGSKLKGMAHSAVSAAKKALGIHSPSRVFRDQVGKHIATGTAEGIKRNTSKVTEAARKQAKAAAEAAKKATKKINDTVYSANKTYLGKVQALNKKLTADIKKANDDYKKELADRAKSVYEAVGLFDKIESKKINPVDLTSNLQGQINQMQQFQKDLTSIAKHGGSKAFVDELRQMGVGSADEIHAIAGMSKDQLGKYASLWKQKHSLADKEAQIELAGLKTATAKNVAAMKTAANKELDVYKKDWLHKIGTLGDDVKKLGNFKNGGKVLGKDTVAGLIAGLKSMNGELAKTGDKLAKTVTTSIKKKLKIHSPSRVMKQLGGYTGQGLAIGMADKVATISKSADKMAAAAVPSIKPIQTPQQSVIRKSENVADVTQGQQNSAAITSQNAEYYFEIPVMIDGRVAARATARFTQDELDRLKREKQRAKGLR